MFIVADLVSLKSIHCHLKKVRKNDRTHAMIYIKKVLFDPNPATICLSDKYCLLHIIKCT